MKKSFTLFLLLPILFFSCGDDDDDISFNGGDIVGVWNFSSAEPIHIDLGNKELNAQLTKDFKALYMDGMGYVTVEYKSNGAVIYTTAGETETGSYTINGSKLTTSDGTTTETALYDVSGNTLRMRFDGTKEMKAEVEGLPGVEVKAFVFDVILTRAH